MAKKSMLKWIILLLIVFAIVYILYKANVKSLWDYFMNLQ